MRNKYNVILISILLVSVMVTGCLRIPTRPNSESSGKLPPSEAENPLPPEPTEPIDPVVPADPEQEPAVDEHGAGTDAPLETEPTEPEGVEDKELTNVTPPKPKPKTTPGVSVFLAIADENVRLLTSERERSGLKALGVSQPLTETAEWVAREYLKTGTDVSAEAIKKKLSPYPELAATSFSMHRASATGTAGDRFARWFAEKRHEDVTGSESLRDDIMASHTTLVGVACVGGVSTVHGKEEYTMVFVWLFMPQPSPTGISDDISAAVDNIAILNAERAARGLRTLQTHTKLMDLAYLKAQDILENLPYDGLAHESAKLGSPHEMIMAGIQPAPLSTAENLWTQYGSYHSGFMDGVSQKAHEGLMNSEGHRKNMLQPEFTHVGVGVAAGLVEGLYKVVLVQLFITEAQ